jgi:hypothetical protein
MTIHNDRAVLDQHVDLPRAAILAGRESSGTTTSGPALERIAHSLAAGAWLHDPALLHTWERTAHTADAEGPRRPDLGL